MKYERAVCAQLRCFHNCDAGHIACEVLCHCARELETSAGETCCISALEMRIAGESRGEGGKRSVRAKKCGREVTC